MNKEKTQYSKKIPIATGIIFVLCIVVSFIMPVEKSVYVTCVSVSGGIFGASIIWYLKKAQVENTFKLKSELYKIASQTRLDYNKQMLEIQQMYRASDMDIQELEMKSPMDELTEEALGNLQSYVSVQESEADQNITIQ